MRHMKQKPIAVLFGGRSPEYEVSLASAAGVLEHMDRRRYLPVMVGITQQGEWYHFTGSIGQIAAGAWQSGPDCTPALLSPNPKDRSLLVFREGAVTPIPLDGVFPILHGKNGEDGTVQGLCQLAGLPVVGCGSGGDGGPSHSRAGEVRRCPGGDGGPFGGAPPLAPEAAVRRGPGQPGL